MKNRMTIICTCGKKVILKLIGGQYQDSYIGNCKCGCRWLLEDVAAE
mgnify:FL=1